MINVMISQDASHSGVLRLAARPELRGLLKSLNINADQRAHLSRQLQYRRNACDNSPRYS